MPATSPRILRACHLVATLLFVHACGGGGESDPAPPVVDPPAPPAPPKLEGFVTSSTVEVLSAGLEWPETLLQLSHLAADTVNSAYSSGSPSLSIDCPAISHMAAGSGSIVLTLVDAGVPGASSGDRVESTFLHCASRLVNGVVDGRLQVTLGEPGLAGLGSAVHSYAGSIDVSGLDIDGIGLGTIIDGTTAFEYRESREQTLIEARVGSSGIEVPVQTGSGALVTGTIRNARYSTETDHTSATRRAKLAGEYLLDFGDRQVSFVGEQIIPFAATVGNAPLSGQMKFVATLGGELSVNSNGGISSTDSLRYVMTRTTGFNTSEQTSWGSLVQGYFWWDWFAAPAFSSASYPFGSHSLPPLRVRTTVPSAPGTSPVVLSNPVELIVYLTDRATQTSLAGTRIVRLDGTQPDVFADLTWNHAMLVLRSPDPLPPGMYEFRSPASMQPEAGIPPGTPGDSLKVSFEVR